MSLPGPLSPDPAYSPCQPIARDCLKHRKKSSLLLTSLRRYCFPSLDPPPFCIEKLGVVVQKGVSLAGTMETPGGGFNESGEPNPSPVRWVAPVDPVTGAMDTRLCFVYADLWRRLLSPEAGELEPLQAWGEARVKASAGPPPRTGKCYRCSCV